MASSKAADANGASHGKGLGEAFGVGQKITEVDRWLYSIYRLFTYANTIKLVPFFISWGNNSDSAFFYS